MKEFTFTQASPSSNWIINHNLNDYPVVDVVLTDGRKILPGTMIHQSANRLLINFAQPLTGTARLVGSAGSSLTLTDTHDMTDR